jgi:hypothetical protein
MNITLNDLQLLARIQPFMQLDAKFVLAEYNKHTTQEMQSYVGMNSADYLEFVKFLQSGICPIKKMDAIHESRKYFMSGFDAEMTEFYVLYNLKAKLAEDNPMRTEVLKQIINSYLSGQNTTYEQFIDASHELGVVNVGQSIKYKFNLFINKFVKSVLNWMTKCCMPTDIIIDSKFLAQMQTHDYTFVNPSFDQVEELLIKNKIDNIDDFKLDDYGVPLKCKLAHYEA